MIALAIPAPWPTCFKGKFLYVSGDFTNSGNNTSGSIDIQCHVLFPTLNSHAHCQIIKQSINQRGYEILDCPCGPNPNENIYCPDMPGVAVSAHKLLIVSTHDSEFNRFLESSQIRFLLV